MTAAFLEALHFFTVENVRWRALPERFGHWNSVWKRFDRLSKAGVFEAFFDTLASMSSTAHLIQMFELHHRALLTCRRPEQRGARRPSARALARRLHHEDPCKIGRLRRHHRLRPDRRRSLRRHHFETLLDIGPDIQPRAVICDKGYASKARPRGGKSARHRSHRPPQGQRKDQASLLRTHPLQGPSAHRRASDGSSASSASRSDAKRPNETSDQSSASPPVFA